MDKQLRGKLVILNFWTYCCISCLQTLPEIEYLEHKFADEASIAFVGVHSAKFLNERHSLKVKDAVLKYDVRHPVINDEKMVLFRAYERRSWPSQIVLSPKSQAPVLIL